LELLHGLHRSRGPQRAATEAFVEGILLTLPTLPFDLLAARTHARFWALLVAEGVQVGERDLMIAATAIAHGCDVVTRDERSFPRIPGLSARRW